LFVVVKKQKLCCDLKKFFQRILKIFTLTLIFVQMKAEKQHFTSQ